MPTVRISIATLIGFVLVVPPTPVFADPIPVTAGSYSLDSTDPSGFRFVGQGFVLFSDTAAISEAVRTCQPCTIGTTIDMTLAASGNLGRWVRPDLPVMFGGQSYPAVFYSGTLRFDAPSVTAPPFGQPNPNAFLQSPFTFSGQLSAFGDSTLSGAPLFTVDLIGSGTARLVLLRVGNEYRFLSQSYSFENLDPVPEPATMSLVGLGLVGLARMARRAARG